MRKLIALAWLLAAAPAAGQMSDPHHCFTAWRPTLSGGVQVLTNTNCGGMYLAPAGPDTTGAKKACSYSGGAAYQWCFVPDSSNVYTTYFKGLDGVDSVVVGRGERIALMGPSMSPPRGSVAATALMADGDGRFRPDVPMLFGRDDSLFVRYMLADSEDVSIHVLDELELQGGAVIDTSQTLVMRWNHTVSSGSSNVLLDYGDRVTLHADSIDATIANVDTFTTVLSLSDVTADDDVIATDDVRADGGTVTAGDSDTGGSLVVSDGSSNTTTLAGTAWGSNVTVSLPFFVIDARLTNPTIEATNQYRYAFYVAGIDTTWVAINTRSAVYDPDGSPTYEYPGGGTVGSATRPYYSYCNTDSVIVTAHGCCIPDDADSHVFLLLMKKNLYRRGI